MRRCSIIRDYGVWPECATCFIVCTHREQCSSIFFASSDLLSADCKCQVCSSTALRSTEASSSQKHVCPFIAKSFWVRNRVQLNTVTAWEAATSVTRSLILSIFDLQSRLPKSYELWWGGQEAFQTHILVQNTCPSVYCNVKSGWEFYYYVCVRGDVRRKAHAFPFAEDVIFLDACWHRPVQTTLHTAHHTVDFNIFDAQPEAMVLLIQER